MTAPVIPIRPFTPVVWPFDDADSGFVVTITQTRPNADRARLVAQLRDVVEVVEGPLGRAFFGGEG